MELLPIPEMNAAGLARAEKAIERGFNSWVVVSVALAAVRDGHGYRLNGYPSFEKYLAGRWGISRSRGYQLMQAAELAIEMSTIGRQKPADNTLEGLLAAFGTERVARAVHALNADARREIFEAIEAGMTPREVRAAVKRYTARASALRRRPELVALPPPLEPQPTELCVWPAGEPIPWDDGAARSIITSPPFALRVPYADGGDVPTYREYLDLMRIWSAELYRVTNTRDGRLVLHVPVDRTLDGREPVQADWTVALRAAGWLYATTTFSGDGTMSRSTAWGSRAAPSSMAPVEAIIVCYRGEWRQDGPRDSTDDDLMRWCGPRGMWRDIIGESDLRHPAVFDRRLAYRLLTIYTGPGDMVGDPFAGRGTVPVLARLMGRRALACDRSPTYVALARHNLERGELGGHAIDVENLRRSAMEG